MALLIIRRPDWPEEHLTLDGPSTIGRSSACTVQLTDPAVSTNHCRIEPVDEFWQITDLKSRTGTWMGDHRITTQYLKDVDTVRIADFELEFHSQTEEDEVPTFAHLGETAAFASSAIVLPAASRRTAAVTTHPRKSNANSKENSAEQRKTSIRLYLAVVTILIGGYLIYTEYSSDSTNIVPSVAHSITQQLPGD